MKFILLEIPLVIGAVLFWTLTLPMAAILCALTLLWNKASTIIRSEPLGPAAPRLSRASA